MKPQPSSSSSWGYGARELPWVTESKSGQIHPKWYFPFCDPFIDAFQFSLFIFTLCARFRWIEYDYFKVTQTSYEQAFLQPQIRHGTGQREPDSLILKGGWETGRGGSWVDEDYSLSLRLTNSRKEFKVNCSRGDIHGAPGLGEVQLNMTGVEAEWLRVGGQLGQCTGTLPPKAKVGL